MDRQKIKEMAERVFRDMAGGMAAGLAYVGCETGLFHCMAGRGAMTVAEVVAASGLDARYVEEWLRGMVACAYLHYDPAAATFMLPEEHAWLLAAPDTDHDMRGLFGMLTSLLAVAPRVTEAFRHGGGVPLADFPPDCRVAIDRMNRGNYVQRLVPYWLAQLPDVQARLAAGGRALDVGCGTGQVALALAHGFPQAEVVGLDPDAASISLARAAAAECSPAPRFVHGTLEAMDGEGAFDLVTLCDVLHDLPAPVPLLRAISARMADSGVLLAIEPKVADQLEENIHPLGAMFHGFSVFHCLTQSLAQHGAGLGACIGPTRTIALLREGGFEHVEILAIRSPTNLFYAARR